MDLELELACFLCHHVDQTLAPASLPPAVAQTPERLVDALSKLERRRGIRVSRTREGAPQVVDITVLPDIRQVTDAIRAERVGRGSTKAREASCEEALAAVEDLIEHLECAPSAGPRHLKLVEDLRVLASDSRSPENQAKVSRWWMQAKPYFEGLEEVEGVMGLAGRASAALGLWKV